MEVKLENALLCIGREIKRADDASVSFFFCPSFFFRSSPVKKPGTKGTSTIEKKPKWFDCA